MGSCTTKQKRVEIPQKPFDLIKIRIEKRYQKEFADPAIRSKIFNAKDAKAPKLNLEANLLRSRRISQRLTAIAPEN